MKIEERIQIAEKIAEKINGARVWNGGQHVRIYKTGFAAVTNDGKVNTDAARAKYYDEVRVACDELGIAYGRTV